MLFLTKVAKYSIKIVDWKLTLEMEYSVDSISRKML